MKVLIVEDETIASERLTDMIQSIDKNLEVIDVLDTVEGTKRWLKNNNAPDLIFLDIQLADGLSFEIFEGLQVDIPVIFTTAYDQYAIKAFKLNSVDYLLKPIDQAELGEAIKKFKSNRNNNSHQVINPQDLLNLINQPKIKYKERFVIKVGEHLKTVLTPSVSVFYSQDKATYLITETKQKYIIDYTLDQLVDMIDPGAFFRINRKYIVNVSAIEDIITYSNSRLKIVLNSLDQDDIIVARDRVNEFKSWLDN